jgi:hypothetical protein
MAALTRREESERNRHVDVALAATLPCGNVGYVPPLALPGTAQLRSPRLEKCANFSAC